MRQWTPVAWSASLLAASAFALSGGCGRIGFEPTSTDPFGPSARLAQIDLWVEPGISMSTAMEPAFESAVANYSVQVGLGLEQVQVSAVPIEPTTVISIQGATTASGELSDPIALALGVNVITVIGTSVVGEQAVYTLDLSRAGALAQQAYVKASNPGATDLFGRHLAISGDTLAVSSHNEDSAARGVDGDPLNDAAGDSGAVYVFVRSSGIWSQQAYLKSSNSEAGDEFGVSVALAGDTLVVGAMREDSSSPGVGGNQADNGTIESGAAYVFVRTAGVWSQQAYLKASNPGVSDDFGYKVALSGDTVAVAAHVEDSATTGVNGNQADNAASSSGAVYVFTRAAGVWSQQAYLKSSNTGADDYFGSALALHGDTLAVGALFEDSAAIGVNGNQADNTATDSGAVYVFARAAGVWSQVAYLKASNTDANDQFGTSLALFGNTLVVGAIGEASAVAGVDGNPMDNTAASSGAAYVFVHTGGVWSQQAYLKPSNPQAGDYFGHSVAVFRDVLVVGAMVEDGAGTGIDGDQASNGAAYAGAAYQFSRTGSLWTQQRYIKASNTETLDYFGCEVALSGDTLAVGAYLEDGGATGIDGNQADNSVDRSGAVYVFR